MSTSQIGPGRPKKKQKAVALVTRRVRRLIDLAHDGNIKAASEETGIPYATLRDLYSGRRSNPGIATVSAFASHYDIPMGWFTDERQSETVPLSGLVVYLNPTPDMKARRREASIPFAAWEFQKVLRAIDSYLDLLPPSPERPIAGEATGAEQNQRLAMFLLHPLLAAEALGEPGAIVPHYSHGGDGAHTREEEERWVGRLRELGRMWEAAMPEFLSSARSVRSS